MKTQGLKLIGKGLFSKVYRLNDSQVLVNSVCYVKECISFNWHNSEGIFPVIEREDYQQYIMEFFEPVKSLKDSLCEEHYAIYQELRKLEIGYIKNNHDLFDAWYKQFQTISNETYRDALTDMLEHLTNYGTDIKFEISPRNVAVKDGKLILLDVFFMSSQANEQRTSKKKRYQY